jgi:DivIVA domain-containing protein
MARPNGREPKPDPDDETRQLAPVGLETTEFIALDPSEDPVAEIASPSFPPAFRGYDRRAVDAYVMRVTEIVAELHAARSPRAAVKRALERVGRETTGILQNARETADEITVQSRVRADERCQEAEREAQRLRAEAEAHVRALDAATDEIWVERRRILDSTLQLGERLQAMAREAAAEFPADGEEQGEGRRGGPRATSNGSKEEGTEQRKETARPPEEAAKRPANGGGS